jgi:ankyrin repeat protein
MTPLLVAASLGNAALVKLLIESGADINVKTKVCYGKSYFRVLSGINRSDVVLERK